MLDCDLVFTDDVCACLSQLQHSDASKPPPWYEEGVRLPPADPKKIRDSTAPRFYQGTCFRWMLLLDLLLLITRYECLRQYYSTHLTQFILAKLFIAR
jgi:hypothetical protein